MDYVAILRLYATYYQYLIEIQDKKNFGKSYKECFFHEAFPIIYFYQNQLNKQLFKNQRLIREYSLADSSKKVKYASDSSTSAKNTNYQSQNQHQQNDHKTQNLKKRRNISADKSSQEYIPIDEQSDKHLIFSFSQTKNVPKNYGKSILNYIKKYQNNTNRVLDHLGIDNQQFYKVVDSYKDNINSIAQLRSLWIQKHNQYAKAFRILSIQHLRKHSLQHIFNSRVQNYGRHIKYRQKIIKAVGHPEMFTNMKDF